MIDQRYKDLIEKLIKGTELKRLNWEKTKRQTEFKVELGSSYITVDNWVLDTGIQCVDMAVYNGRGELIDRIAYENDAEEGEDYKEVLRLYQVAERAYLKVDETFDEIMSQLNFDD